MVIFFDWCDMKQSSLFGKQLILLLANVLLLFKNQFPPKLFFNDRWYWIIMSHEKKRLCQQHEITV